MESTPLVSIVVTVYNKEDFIKKTLESTLQQSYQNLEIIVVDDGSTDRSSEIIYGYASSDHRIKMIGQQNSGVASAINRGLREVQGEYIVILDGDDIIYPKYIERAVKYLEDHTMFDIVHVSWDWIDEQDKRIHTVIAPEPDDYLKTLLLGNIFAVHAMMFRKILLDRVGLISLELKQTVDWEFWTRCAKMGARFGRIEDILVGTRESSNRVTKTTANQQQRFLPVIEMIFDNSLPKKYYSLKNLCIVRHDFFLMENFLSWGLKSEARTQFNIGLQHLMDFRLCSSFQMRYIRGFLHLFTLLQTMRFSVTIARNGAPLQAFIIWVWLLLYSRLGRAVQSSVKRILKRVIRKSYIEVRRYVILTDAHLQRVRRISGYKNYSLHQSINLDDIQRISLGYLASLRVYHTGEFVGYRHSACTTKPVLYATLAALLLKHLYGFIDEYIDEELEFVLRFQSDDGLFRDPVITCPMAETCDWWGWRHLTLHALMTLALYNKPARKEICYLERFKNKDRFREYLCSRDWSVNVDNTSNEIQNIGVMLQYARDYQNSATAGALLEILFEVLDAHQDPGTGLYGHHFETPRELSLGVQAGYHFWLLYFYDHRSIHHIERVIDNVLKTQNILGGYGAQWNSSACEDIDSVDPLVRLSRLTDYRYDDIQASLQRALPAILQNLNGDGGWVFRRHEALTMGHPQMFSAPNESNVFYTWFRTVGLAYCLIGMKNPPLHFHYRWNFCHAPGHQFL